MDFKKCSMSHKRSQKSQAILYVQISFKTCLHVLSKSFDITYLKEMHLKKSGPQTSLPMLFVDACVGFFLQRLGVKPVDMAPTAPCTHHQSRLNMVNNWESFHGFHERKISTLLWKSCWHPKTAQSKCEKASWSLARWCALRQEFLSTAMLPGAAPMANICFQAQNLLCTLTFFFVFLCFFLVPKFEDPSQKSTKYFHNLEAQNCWKTARPTWPLVAVGNSVPDPISVTWYLPVAWHHGPSTGANAPLGKR